MLNKQFVGVSQYFYLFIIHFTFLQIVCLFRIVVYLNLMVLSNLSHQEGRYNEIQKKISIKDY